MKELRELRQHQLAELEERKRKKREEEEMEIVEEEKDAGISWGMGWYTQLLGGNPQDRTTCSSESLLDRVFYLQDKNQN